MSTRDSRGDRGTDLGYCPHCEVSIPSVRLLIRYESADGWPKTFAECPACGDVVSPV